MQFIDLEGINFSDFIMSTSGTYHVLHVEISMVFTDDKLSQKANLCLLKYVHCYIVSSPNACMKVVSKSILIC